MYSKTGTDNRKISDTYIIFESADLFFQEVGSNFIVFNNASDDQLGDTVCDLRKKPRNSNIQYLITEFENYH